MQLASVLCTPVSSASIPTSLSSNKKPKESSCTCPICEDAILDSSSKRRGQESIFCEGECNTWLHRRCAGLSRVSFKSLAASSVPFYCPQCRISKLVVEVASLQATVAQLSSDLSVVKSSVTVVSEKMRESVPVVKSTIRKDRPSSSESCDSSPSPGGASSIFKPKSPSKSEDRLSNLVITGILECPQGTRRTDRALRDQDSIISVFSPLCPSFATHSIRNLLRLGKYKVTHSRPILVKLHRPLDVSVILSNTRQLSSSPGITVRRDLSSADREVRSILLKVCRSLLSSGANSRDVKIRATGLYVHNILHGKVVNKSFVRVNSPTDHLPTSLTDSATSVSSCPTFPPDSALNSAFVPIDPANSVPTPPTLDSASASFQ